MRAMRAGLLLALAYVVVVSGTLRLTDRPVRPLYDGAGNVVPYRWVNRPWYVPSSFNVKPRASRGVVPLEGDASALTGLTSGDSQVVLNLPAGAFPARPGATGVEIGFTPLDPDTLGAAPAGLRPNGNAYRVEMGYRPAGGAVTATARDGNIVMIVPEQAETILYSGDGQAWEPLPTQLLGDPTTLGASFSRAGYYLGATSEPEVPNPNGSGKNGIALAVAITGAVALAIGFGPAALRRRRPGRPSGRRPAGRGGRTGPPPRRRPVVRKVRRRRR
jgi:hypothetical protein